MSSDTKTSNRSVKNRTLKDIVDILNEITNLTSEYSDPEVATAVATVKAKEAAAIKVEAVKKEEAETVIEAREAAVKAKEAVKARKAATRYSYRGGYKLSKEQKEDFAAVIAESLLKLVELVDESEIKLDEATIDKLNNEIEEFKKSMDDIDNLDVINENIINTTFRTAEKIHHNVKQLISSATNKVLNDYYQNVRFEFAKGQMKETNCKYSKVNQRKFIDRVSVLTVVPSLVGGTGLLAPSNVNIVIPNEELEGGSIMSSSAIASFKSRFDDKVDLRKVYERTKEQLKKMVGIEVRDTDNTRIERLLIAYKDARDSVLDEFVKLNENSSIAREAKEKKLRDSIETRDRLVVIIGNALDAMRASF